MGANKIGKAIKENCQDDKIMQDLLLELLEYNMTGKAWYKDEYTKIIEKYAQKEEEKKNENS